MKKLFLLLTALLTLGVSGAWATDISVGTGTGTFYKDGTEPVTPSSNNGFAKKWVSSAAPTLTITCGSNDMVINSSDATDTKFRLHTDTYTLSISGDYFITGYSITAYASNGSSKINGTTVGTTDGTATTVSSTGLASKTATFTVAGTANPWMYIKSFSVTIAPTYTVTYTIVDGAATINGGSAPQLMSSAPNIANTVGANSGSSYSNPYCTYSYYSDSSCETPITEIPGACTVYAKITSTSDIPVEFASSIDDVDAQWYTLKLRDYQFYVSGETVTLSSSDITSTSAQWVFTGSVCNAYIYNKSAAKYLIMDNGALALSDTRQPWILAPHQSSSINNDFYLYYASDYKFPFRNSQGALAYSQGPFYETANAASFVATEIKTNYKEDIIANVQPFFTTGVGSYFGLKSSVKSSYEERVTDATTACDAEEYSALVAVVSNPSNFEYPTSGYYRIKNYSSNNYFGKSGSTATVNFGQYDAASVVYLTQSGSEGSYKYTINMQGANYQHTHDQATGSYEFAIAGPGRFTMNESSSNTLFGYYYDNNGVIGLDNLATGGDAAKWTLESATTVTIPLNVVNGKSYATMYLPFDVELTAPNIDMQAGTMTGTLPYIVAIEGTSAKLTLKQVTKIPAGTPVLLENNEDGDVESVTVSITSDASSLSGKNDLQGTYEDKTELAANEFIFGKKGTELGFWKLNTSNGNKVGANKAYLVNSDATVKGFSLDFSDVTGINGIAGSSAQQEMIFDLSGRRVSQPTHGLYIKNGKKVLVK